MNALYRTRGQWAVWAVFLAAGAVAGALGDLLLALARRMEGRRALEAAAAFCAGGATAVIGAAVCLRTTGGEARLYMAAAIAIGALLYRCTLGWLARLIARGLRRLGEWCRARIGASGLLKRLLR